MIREEWSRFHPNQITKNCYTDFYHPSHQKNDSQAKLNQAIKYSLYYQKNPQRPPLVYGFSCIYSICVLNYQFSQPQHHLIIESQSELRCISMYCDKKDIIIERPDNLVDYLPLGNKWHNDILFLVEGDCGQLIHYRYNRPVNCFSIDRMIYHDAKFEVYADELCISQYDTFDELMREDINQIMDQINVPTPLSTISQHKYIYPQGF